MSENDPYSLKYESPSGAGNSNSSSNSHSHNTVPETPQGSHPAIQIKPVPIVPGPLSRLDEIRSSLLGNVAQKTKEELSHTALELLLGEALYSEKQRLRHNRPNIFTRTRHKRDLQLWNSIQSGL